MTNPNNAIGTNGAFGGRTSVNAFNDIMGAFQSRGVLSGWGISPSSGMTVSVGGSGTVRDVAVAEDASGNKTSVNNISGSPVQVTLDSAPASNARFDAIVVYVDKPPVNSNATQDNPECCGIIPVSGTAASSPAYPSDATIRSAITADGASGATAYYAVVGYVRVASGTTAITAAMITAGAHPTTNAMVQTANIATGAVTSDKIDSTAFRNILRRGDTIVVDGDSPLNIKYPAQWNGGNNNIDVLIPFNFLIASDVTNITAAISSSPFNVTIFPFGQAGQAITVSLAQTQSYSFQTGMTLRLTPSTTITHTTNEGLFVRLTGLAITAA